MEETLYPRQERLRRQAKGKKIRRRILTVFACIVGVFTIVWTVSTLERLFNWNSMELVSVKHEVLEETVQKEAIVVRKEVVLTVPNSKSAKYLVEDNSRVHVGELLLKIPSAEISRTGGDSVYQLYTPLSGTVSKKFDGLESVLSPASIESLNLESVYEKVCNGTMKGRSQQGEAAVRIVDNLSPALLCFPHSGLKLEAGGSVLLRIGDSEELLSATVSNIAGAIAVIRIAPVPNDLIQDRVCKIEVVTRRKKGMVVPASSLVKKDEVSGVYAVTAGKMRWTEVEVEGIFEEKAVVKGVSLGQEVVANPETI